MVKDEIESIKENVHIENQSTLWDFTKCQLRSVTITYSKKLANERKKQESELKNQIEKLEKEITYNVDKIEEYYETKGIWEGLQREKTEGIILRSKVEWAEAGEKNTKYFLNLEKRSTIPSILKNNYRKWN